MSVAIVRLGSERLPGEGTRIGTVRHPPRGVPKSKHSEENWYDVWFPVLAPSAETVKQAKAAKSDADWSAAMATYRKEMQAPDARQALALLAALSHAADFSVGCYCEDESRCHRSALAELLAERGASLRTSP